MGMYVAKPQSTKPPKNRVFERVRTRKLDRSVAHARMKHSGAKNVNKHDYHQYKTPTGMLMSTRLDSYFSTHWREVADMLMPNM